MVDPSGLCSEAGSAWGLDWQVQSERGWEDPAGRSRQRLLDRLPVVETSLAVGGGSVAHRCWAEMSRGGPVAVVEIANRSPSAVAAALVARPRTPSGRGAIGRVELDGAEMVLDGEASIHLGTPPGDWAVADSETGDALTLIGDGDRTRRQALAGSCPAGRASIACVWALDPGATLRVRLGGRRGEPSPMPAGRAKVAAGWSARLARGAALDLPEGLWSDALTSQRPWLVCGASGPSGGGVGHVRRVGQVRRVVAAMRAGLACEVGDVIKEWAREEVTVGDARPAAVGATLWGLWWWGALPRRAGAGDAPQWPTPAPAVASRAEALIRAGAAGPGAPLNPDVDPVEAVWMAAGLRASAAILDAMGEGREDDRARWARAAAFAVAPIATYAAPRGACPSDRTALGGETRGETGGEAGGEAGWEAACCGSRRLTTAVLLAASLGLVDSRHPSVTQALVAAGAACRARAGVATQALATRVAVAALAGADASAAVSDLLAASSGTWAWPTAVGSFAGGEGHDLTTAALVADAGRALLVDDFGGHGPPPAGAGSARVVLCRWLPRSWLGQPLEVEGVPTLAGSVSFALRWHGARPALLWEVTGAGTGAGTGVELSAPGLDGSWSASGRAGEALLSPVREALIR